VTELVQDLLDGQRALLEREATGQGLAAAMARRIDRDHAVVGGEAIDLALPQ
jgi:hypothetical protein